MEQDAVGWYLEQISRYPLLGVDEERRLACVIRTGREAAQRIEAGRALDGDDALVAEAAVARKRFFLANLRLVVSFARRYPTPPGLDLSDLIQEGNNGLAGAVDAYDERRGFRFSTFASDRIRQAISRAIDKKAAMVRMPIERSSRLRAALRVVDGDVDALTDDLRLDAGCFRHVSLDAPLTADGDATVGDLLPLDGVDVEAAVGISDERRRLRSSVQRLPELQRRAIELRFGLDGADPLPYTAIAAALGVGTRHATAAVTAGLDELRTMALALALAS